jgi:thiamine transport system ATP-binding protein
MNSGLALKDVTVRFDGEVALENVSFTVEEGSFFTLVGPSGSGKTTALRTIAGFESPSAGEVYLDGDPVTGNAPEERNVGVVFQEYALFPHLSVRENVAYGLRYRDPPDGQSTGERVTELLDLVDMEGYAEREPETLSGGQQQRIALARALAPGPDVLLLDEPLSALDARLRERLRSQIKSIQRSLDVTTIYVTHDQREAMAISDRVAVVNDGHIEQTGRPETLYQQPESTFVARFFGDNNVFTATVERDTHTRLTFGGKTFQYDDIEVATGDTVDLMIRPESFTIGGGPQTLTARVDQTEFVGNGYRIHCTHDGTAILVTSPNQPPVGSTVELGFDAEDITLIG